MDGAVTWTKMRRVMVGFGVWGEYFSKLLERDFEKGGCGNVVSRLIVAVVSHNGRDTIQDPGSLQMPRFEMSRQVCSTAAALHSSAGWAPWKQ